MGKIEFARGFVWTVRVDFVLAYQIYEDETEEWREKRERKRKRFFGRLETEGLELEEDRVRDGKKFETRSTPPHDTDVPLRIRSTRRRSSSKFTRRGPFWLA